MEANIKVIRPKILKSDSEDSFFMVNEDWVKNNKRFVKDHGLTIEYPKESDQLENENTDSTDNENGGLIDNSENNNQKPPKKKKNDLENKELDLETKTEKE